MPLLNIVGLQQNILCRVCIYKERKGGRFPVGTEQVQKSARPREVAELQRLMADRVFDLSESDDEGLLPHLVFDLFCTHRGQERGREHR